MDEDLMKLCKEVYEQTDMGKGTAQLAPNGGDSDYEYWVTLNPKETQKALLSMIKDNFDTQGKFKEWLDKKGIEYSFMAY